jgi:hypothetical protein
MDFVPLLQKRLDDCVKEGVDSVCTAQGVAPGKEDSHSANLTGEEPTEKIRVISKLLVLVP